MKEKYLLFYLKTGGGHLAPAKSIANYILQNKGDGIEPVLVDGLAKAPSFLRYSIEDGYRMSQTKAVWSFEAIYAINKIPLFAAVNVHLVNYFVKPYIRELILEQRPSKLVVFHFLLITPVFDVLRELKLDIPVITVVTDPYTAHPIWFREKKQNYVVFSDRLKNYMIDRNIPSEQINVYPFIVNDRFSTPIAAEKIPIVKQQMGFLPNKKLVLIFGGGDGMPRGQRILKQLLRSKIDAEIAIVCGHNQKLYDYAMLMKQEFPEVLLTVYGFVDFAYELMNVSDVVITKCGASTFMEILMSGKVPVINNYIWEQEKGNMEQVRDNNMGIYEHNIPRMVDNVIRILSQSSLYAQFAANIKNAKLENGTPKVAEFILGFH